MYNINQIRSDFPILAKKIHGHPLVYFDNAATTQKPQIVLDALQNFYSGINSNIHRGVHYLSEQASEAYENARESVRTFINAKYSHEVIFTHGTTDSINLVAGTFGQTFIVEGDEILITQMEHHSNIIPWQLLCEKKGAKLKYVPLDSKGSLQVNVLINLINKKNRLISLTSVSNVLGVKNPIKDIIRIAHSLDIPVLIDGAQAVQHLPVDVQELDCDFFAFSGHKMYAATGIGILYGKEKWLDKMPPYQGGGGMIQKVKTEQSEYGRLPFKFEAGTPNIAGAISLAAAISYISNIGIQNIAEHEKQIIEYLQRKLEEEKDVTLYGSGNGKYSALSFNLDHVNAYDAGMILDKLGIAVRTGHHCAELLMDHFGIEGTLRCSIALYNTLEEVDAFIHALQKVKSMLQ